jgi:Zn-dependent peptidase ImmA (M78 family)
MATTSLRERLAAQNEGGSAAIREGMRLSLSPDQPIDIFRIVADARLRLVFQPLDRGYGLFARQEKGGWIVIHSGHPLALQRYTAAHEYGHWVLGHTLSMDSEVEIFGREASLQELAAQAFAADFLMPLPVINRAMDRLALPRGQRSWNAIDVYQLSLELAVSYRAMLTQLSALKFVAADRLRELRRLSPADIRKGLNSGAALANSRADLWLVERCTQRRWLRLQLNDEMRVRVPVPPLGPSGWETEWDGPDECLRPIAEDPMYGVRVLPGLVGPPAHTLLGWRARAVGSGTLRVWPAGPSPSGGHCDAGVLTVAVEVIERGNGPGLHVLQRQRALAVAAHEYQAALSSGQGH